MKDLLAGLKSGLPKDDGATNVPVDDNSKYMADFFASVDKLLADIDSTNKKVQQVKDLHNRMLSSPQAADKDKNELENAMGQIKRLAAGIRVSLKTMETGIEESEKKDKASAELRIRKTQHSTLSRKFIEVMSEYNKAQTDYREGCKGRIKRQLEISGQKHTDAELETMLDSSNPNVFAQAMVMDDQQARQALEDCQKRHQEILKLETAIKELHDMFLDMAMLVDQQGEMVDRIEYNVEQSVDYVAKASEDTKKAVRYQAAARKKKLLIIGIVSIIAAIAILIFLIASGVFKQ